MRFNMRVLPSADNVAASGVSSTDRTNERRPLKSDVRDHAWSLPVHPDIAPRQGSCACRMMFGVVLPTFTRMGSRSLPLPVYLTVPSMFTSSVK